MRTFPIYIVYVLLFFGAVKLTKITTSLWHVWYVWWVYIYITTLHHFFVLRFFVFVVVNFEVKNEENCRYL